MHAVCSARQASPSEYGTGVGATVSGTKGARHLVFESQTGLNGGGDMYGPFSQDGLEVLR